MAISSVLGSSALAPAGLGFRNVLINGAMNIAQRGTEATSLSSQSGTYHTVDRWNIYLSGAGTYTQSQSTDAPPGFGTSLKMQCTSASGSLAAGAYGQIQQLIEGQNVQQFAKGTSSAKPFMVSFWVKAYQTGTYVVELYDATNTRSVSRTYTVNASATWEYKTIQFPADTTGALANSNAGALILVHWFSAGTTYTSGAADGAWASVSSGNRAAGLNVNVGSSTSNYWQVTGVQLEQNTVPTPFEQRPIGVELMLCQRYFTTRTDKDNNGGGSGTTALVARFSFQTEMRIAPTATILTAGSFIVGNDYSANYTASTVTLSGYQGGTRTMRLSLGGFATYPGNGVFVAQSDSSGTAVFAFSAEL